MILPLADTPNPPGRPYVTWALIAINVAVYLFITLPASGRPVNLHDPLLPDYLRVIGAYGKVSAQEVYSNVSANDLLVFRYGFRPAEYAPLTLLSALFLHGGLFHLAGNMLFLYIFGDNVEFRFGRARFLVVYLLCGVIATVFFSLFALNSQAPLLGASGAIFGVLGCYFLWFPRNRVRCILFPLFMLPFFLPARLILGVYLVLDNILPFVATTQAGSGIAHGAHIGGFFGGLAIAWGHDRWYLFRRGKKPKVAKAGEMASLHRVCPAVAAGDMEGAADCYLHLERREDRLQIDAPDVLAVGEYLLEHDRLHDALSVFRRFISERQTDSSIDRAYLGAGKVMMRNPRYLTSAYHYFLSAYDLAQSEELAVEAKSCLRRIERQRES
ncbi:MAG: hypothetical protein C0622_06490 [Desulfuromonas sp.]|nr:MAG: hypothetical protein C0622_06490 [Desulfuromonas sp.]